MGMARVFAYLMSQDHVDVSDEGIFSDTSHIILEAMQKVWHKNRTGRNLSATALEQALNQLL